MPVKHLANLNDFHSFRAELREVFIENVHTFHVCKSTHGTEYCDQCHPVGPYDVVSQAFNHPSFYVLYIDHALAQRLRTFFLRLITEHPIDPDEDPNDPDGNSHITTIFMCPYCGTHFTEQN